MRFRRGVYWCSKHVSRDKRAPSRRTWSCEREAGSPPRVTYRGYNREWLWHSKIGRSLGTSAAAFSPRRRPGGICRKSPESDTDTLNVAMRRWRVDTVERIISPFSFLRFRASNFVDRRLGDSLQNLFKSFRRLRGNCLKLVLVLSKVSYCKIFDKELL